jgi:hypothetical protein
MARLIMIDHDWSWLIMTDHDWSWLIMINRAIWPLTIVKWVVWPLAKYWLIIQICLRDHQLTSTITNERNWKIETNVILARKPIANRYLYVILYSHHAWFSENSANSNRNATCFLNFVVSVRWSRNTTVQSSCGSTIKTYGWKQIKHSKTKKAAISNLFSANFPMTSFTLTAIQLRMERQNNNCEWSDKTTMPINGIK